MLLVVVDVLYSDLSRKPAARRLVGGPSPGALYSNIQQHPSLRPLPPRAAPGQWKGIIQVQEMGHSILRIPLMGNLLWGILLPRWAFLRAALKSGAFPPQALFLLVPLSQASDLHHTLKAFSTKSVFFLLYSFQLFPTNKSLQCLIPSWQLLIGGPKLTHT